MGKIINSFVVVFGVLLFSGCAVQQQIVGEFLLEQKNYDKGSDYFKAKIRENKNDASSQYYYGRFLIANKRYKQSLKYLKKATILNNKNADYHSWLGVNYSLLEMLEDERKEYLIALKIDKKHLQSLTYLAHNYYDNKEYLKSLEYYNKVLKILPESQTALFNRAMILNKLERKPEELLAWKVYLKYYPSGTQARDAVKYLNNLGSFDYRNHLIGLRTVTLKNILFKPFSSTIDYDSKSSLDFLGKVLTINKNIEIHIVGYQEKNSELAHQKVKEIKKYILKKYPSINSTRLKLSWFSKPKNVIIKNRRYLLGESIDFITVTK
ncbi:MAG: hypothetical protein U9R16_01890 [Campylobacterota bacterium]|nr:hypothetical protein [Campylobacterota bacterium]